METILKQQAKGTMINIRQHLVDDPDNPGQKMQHFWNSTKGGNRRYYTFILNFKDDSDGKIYEGEVSGSQPFKYKVEPGSKIMCDIYTSTSSYKQTKFKEVEKIAEAAQPGGFTSTYNNPENNKRIAAGMAMTLAILTYKILSEHPDEEKRKYPSGKDKIFAVAENYFGWITNDKSIHDRDILSRRWYALENAINSLPLFPETISSVSDILEDAKEFLNRTLKLIE